MFGFVFFQSLSRLKNRRSSKSRAAPNCCYFSRNPISSMSCFTLLIFVLVYILSKDTGLVGLSFASNVSSTSSNKAGDSRNEFLLSTGNGVSLYFPSNHSKRVIVSELTKATHIGFENANSKKASVFWTDVLENKIYRTILGSPSSAYVDVVSRGIGSLQGLAVDWITQNLYWIDAQYSRIEVSKFDGSMRTTLLDEVNHSLGLEIDPLEGYLFWMSMGNGSQIVERCNCDGSNRITIYPSIGEGTPPLMGIGALAVDINQKKLYWINTKSQILEKCNYDGSVRKTVISQNKLFASAISMAVYKGNIFWVDLEHHLLIKSSEKNRNITETLTIMHPALYDVEIILPQEDFLDRRILACSLNNGGCSHLCLRGTDENYSCLCPYSLQLASNNKTCKQHGSVLGYASREEKHHNVFFVDWEHPQTWVFPPLKIPIQNVVGFAADPSKDAIFWIDNNKIQHQLLTGQTETILELDYFEAYSLALDWKSRNLYLLSERLKANGSSVISVCKDNGHFFSHLVWKEMFKPKQLAVDSENRFLFWLHEKRQDELTLHILEFSTLDGTQRKVFLQSYRTIQSFVADISGKQLCWLAESETSINCRHYFKEETRVLSPSQSQITVMCSYNGNLLYANQLGSIKSLNVSLNGAGVTSLNINTSHSLCFLTVMDPKRTLANYYMSTDNLAKSLCIEKKIREYACQYEKAPPYLLYFSSEEPHSLILNDISAPDLFPGRLLTHLTGGGDTVDVLSEISETYIWVESRNSIKSIRRDTKEKRNLTISEFEIMGLAIDTTAKNLYWSIPSKGQIWVSRLDGSSPFMVFSNDLVYPTILVVDSLLELLLWSNCPPNQSCSIQVSNLAGQKWETLLSKNVSEISDMVVNDGVLYWCNPFAGTIENLVLKTKERRVLHLSSNNSTRPGSLAVFNNTLYWTESCALNGSIWMKSLTKDKEVTLLLDNVTKIGKMLLVSGQSKITRNVCHLKNGGCSELCLAGGNNQNPCFCSHGFPVNGTQCEKYGSYLIVAIRSKIVSFKTIDDSSSDLNSPAPDFQPNVGNLTNLAALTYDPFRERIFFSDLYRTPYLFSIYPNGTGLKSELKETLRLRSIEGIVFDVSSRYLFWTESGNPSIWSLKEGSKPAEIFVLSKGDKPRGIAIHTCSGRIFWTNWKKSEPKIEVGYSEVDSLSNKQHRKGFETFLSADFHRPEALTIQGDLLYWGDVTDDNLFYIGSCHLDTMIKKVLLSGNHRTPFSIVPFDDNILFWTDRENGAVCRANLNTGESCKVIKKHSEPVLGMSLIGSKENIRKCRNLNSINMIEDSPATESATSIVIHKPNCVDQSCDHHTTISENTSSIYHKALLATGYCLTVIILSTILLVLVYHYRRNKSCVKYQKKMRLSMSALPLSSSTDTASDSHTEQILKSCGVNPSFEMDDVHCSSIFLQEGETLISN